MIDNFQNSSQTETYPQIDSMINNTEDDKSVNFFFGGSKRFSRYYSLRINANLSYADYFTNINSELINNTSLTQNYTLTNKFKIKKKVEFDLGLNFTQNNFKSVQDNEFRTWRPFGEFAWSISEKFLFQTDYSYRLQYQGSDLINENQALNASVRYHVAKSVYFTLLGGNLLGNDTLVNSSFDSRTNNTIINTRELLGRYFIAQIRYKF